MMGRERAVIRWEIHRQVLLDELLRVEQELVASETQVEGSQEALRARLAELQARLRALGPDPRAKMG